MRPSISFQIQNQTISRTDTFHVVAASRNYLHAEFVFLTDEWCGVAKTALFAYSGGVKQVLLEDDCCEVPWEALVKPGILKVSVFGGDLITVGQAIVRVCESGYKDGSAPSPPTPDIYAQILDAANAAKEIAEGVRKDADDGVFDGADGKQGSQGDVGPAGPQGPPGEDGAQTDWNESDPGSQAFLKNRPFGEEYYAVTWDGMPTGEPVTLDDLPWYKISDALPDPESVRDASVSIETAEAGTIRFAANPELADGILLFVCSVPSHGDTSPMFIAYDGNGDGLSPGMYCVDLSVASTSLGVTIISTTAEWVSVKTIDPKYLPEGIGGGVNMDDVKAYVDERIGEIENGYY